jgi:hypothetical protein
MGDDVSWSDYSNYLKEYHCRNVDAISGIADLAQTVSQPTLISCFYYIFISDVLFANVNFDDCLMVSSSVSTVRSNLCLSGGSG